MNNPKSRKSARTRQPNKPRTGAESCVVDVLGERPTPYQAQRILAETALATQRERLRCAEIALEFSPMAAQIIALGAT